MLRYNVFNLSHDHVVDMSLDFVGEVPSSYVTSLLSFESMSLVEVEILTFVILVPVPIPMPRFQCRGLQMVKEKSFSLRENP